MSIHLKYGAIASCIIATGCNAHQHSTELTPTDAVKKFQAISDDDLQCFDPKVGNYGKWTNIKSNVSALLSADLLAVYRPICEQKHAMLEPRYNDHLKDRTTDDMLQRFVKNIKYTLAPTSSPDKAIVRATYDHNACSYQECGNYTQYTLTKEGESWRIDDIAIGLKKDHMGDSSWRENYPSLKKKLRAELVDSKKASQ
jgi:hypothetical protein